MPIFPTGYTNGTPASDDRLLFSDTSASNQTKDCALSELPISDATQTALDGKVDNVIAGQNTTVSRNGNTITVNSLGGPAVVTDGFNRNYFTAIEGQTEFTATFDFTENTGSVIVTLNGNVLKPTLDYTEPGLNKVVFVSGLTAGDEVQLITGIKGDKGDKGDNGVGTVASVNSGTHITVDNTDPNNPIVNYDGELFSTTLKDKLDGIEAGAEVNEVNEAPIDGEQYARKNGAWEVVIGGDPLSIVSDITGVTGADRVENIISLTKAEYDAITPDASTIYNITDDGGVSNAVLLTGDQTIAGVKTFSSSPIVPTPNADMEVATKKYVDDNAGGPQKLRITIPGELIADTSNYQGLYFKNESGASWTISNVSIAVGINASGTGAACAVNLYKSSGTEADGINTNAVNLFTTAVNLGTSYSSLTNTPNTTTVENGRWLSLRVTSSAGTTRRASDMQVVITLV